MADEIIQNVLTAIKGLKLGDMKEYNSLVASLNRSDLDEETFCNYILGLKKSVHFVSKEHEALIGVVLKIDWSTYSENAVKEYMDYLADLVSARTYYVKVCIKSLMRQFIPKVEVFGDELVRFNKKFDRIHAALQTIVNLAPLASRFTAEIITNLFPYIGKSLFVLETYMVNILQVSTYVTGIRYHMLALLIDKLMAIDVRIPRHELEKKHDEGELQFEADNETQKDFTTITNVNITKLDQLMVILFAYIDSICHVDGSLDWVQSELLIKELLLIYDGVMLKTQQSSHVQFVLFYAASFHKSFYEAFIESCWKILQDPNHASVIRQASAGYLSSFLARANYIDKTIIRSQLNKLSEWIRKYIDFQDGSNIDADFNKHGPFYSACQALFYVFIYHYKYLLESEYDINFVKSLNLIRIVTSKLNPLKFCLNTIVNMFARITRMHEIVFCYSIIERNNRNVLSALRFDSNVPTRSNEMEMFFPFDPYMLEKSGKFIKPLYLEWTGAVVDDDSEDDDELDASDILSDLNGDKQLVAAASSLDMMCISPGFQLLQHDS